MSATEIREALEHLLAIAKQMEEKEARFIEILSHNDMDSYYTEQCAMITIQLMKLKKVLYKVSDMFYIVGGIER